MDFRDGSTRGRPTRLTDELAESLVQLIKAGNSAATAAMARGVGRSTFYRWMQKGREAKRGRYKEFFDAVQQARAESEMRLVTLISLGAEKDWKAAAFFLERRNPKQWGRRDRQTVTLKGDVRHPVAINAITPERAHDELLKRLAETRERFIQAGTVTLRLVGEGETH